MKKKNVPTDDRYRSRDDRYYEYEASRGTFPKRDKDRKRGNRGNGSERGDNYSTSSYYQSFPAGNSSYDPYSSYYQQQQYYENLRRTNPHAYAEWYNRYFGSQLQMAASQANAERGRESGRESVHSGCSSSKDNER